MIRYFLLISLTVVCLTLGGLALNGHTPTTAQEPDTLPPNNLTPLMRMKLERSKSILEGLALEDYAKIAQNARGLKLLSTEAGWNVIQTKEYGEKSRDFRRSADLIAEAAEKKDVNRATMGYVALTVSCVECHSYMRKYQAGLIDRDAE
jgi:hypothetical protein